MIKVDGKSRHLGSFGSEQEAHEVYWRAAQDVFGQFARKS